MSFFFILFIPVSLHLSLCPSCGTTTFTWLWPSSPRSHCSWRTSQVTKKPRSSTSEYRRSLAHLQDNAHCRPTQPKLPPQPAQALYNSSHRDSRGHPALHASSWGCSSFSPYWAENSLIVMPGVMESTFFTQLMVSWYKVGNPLVEWRYISLDSTLSISFVHSLMVFLFRVFGKSLKSMQIFISFKKLP